MKKGEVEKKFEDCKFNTCYGCILSSMCYGEIESQAIKE